MRWDRAVRNVGIKRLTIIPSRARRRCLALITCAALLSGCADEAAKDDAYARCKNDPKCRGQACVDARGDLYARGDFKAASKLECSVD